jgi:hypothetical protein
MIVAWWSLRQQLMRVDAELCGRHSGDGPARPRRPSLLPLISQALTWVDRHAPEQHAEIHSHDEPMERQGFC